MLAYPLNLQDDDGALLVTSPDVPELATFGEDREEAVARAVDALEEAIAARMYSRLDIPLPSPRSRSGSVYATLPTLTAVKVMLYQGMRDRGIGKAELARRLGWHLPQVDRVLNVQHSSRLEQMDSALAAIGLRLDVSTHESSAAAMQAVAEDAPHYP